MNALFESSDINGMIVRNRLVRSATWEGMCEDDGRPTEKLADCYANLARGGVGLIVSGYAYVMGNGKANKGQMGIYTDAFETDFRKLIDRVHSDGGALAVQIVHSGGQTETDLIGHQPVAPSAVKPEQFKEIPAELTRTQISQIIEAFVAGAARAKAWGADAVQLHGAHGYLINQFLSPHTNQRTDEYGGPIENRSRFALEVYAGVRAEVGGSFPVLIKMNGSDCIDRGLQIDDACYTAAELSDAGIDAIEVSGGVPGPRNGGSVRTGIDTRDKEGYFLDLARRIKESVSCPVMAVGGYRSLAKIESVLNDDGIEYVSLCRPLIREPGLPNRWEAGDRNDAACISCSRCFKPGRFEGGIYCVPGTKGEDKND